MVDNNGVDSRDGMDLTLPPSTPPEITIQNFETVSAALKYKTELDDEYMRKLSLYSKALRDVPQTSPDYQKSIDVHRLALEIISGKLALLSNQLKISLYNDPIPQPEITKSTQKRTLENIQNSDDEENHQPSGSKVKTNDWKTVNRNKNKSKKSHVPTVVGDTVQTSQSSEKLPGSQNSKTAAGPRKKNPPPIFIVPSATWPILLSHLRNRAPEITACAAGRYMKTIVQSEEHFRTIQAFLRSERIEFKSYLLDEDKPLKVVIRGLSLQTRPEQIKTELEIQNFTEVKITQMYRGPVLKRTLMPLFLIQVNNKTDLESLFQIKDIFGMRVTVEKFRGRKGPSQCHQCQEWLHSASGCGKAARCLKCGKNHLTSLCDKPLSEPCTCANCGGQHPSNYHLCPKAPKSGAKNSKKQSKRPHNGAYQSARTFASRKVDGQQPWSDVAAGTSSAPDNVNETSDAQSAAVPITFVPPSKSLGRENEDSGSFIKTLLAFEEKYAPHVVRAAFRKCLPKLRSANTEIDRIWVMYAELSCT